MYILLVANIFFSFVIGNSIRKDRKRNKILQAFIAGTIRSISDYASTTDKIDADNVPEQNTNLPISYKKILESVQYELLKDLPYKSVKKYEKWLIESRSLFWEPYSNDGFVFMNYDLFDNLSTLFHSNTAELMTKKECVYLSDEIVITKNNVNELRGEIGMYEDLFNGKLDYKNFKKENLENQLSSMFIHLKYEYVDQLKKKILKSLVQ